MEYANVVPLFILSGVAGWLFGTPLSNSSIKHLRQKLSDRATDEEVREDDDVTCEGDEEVHEDASDETSERESEPAPKDVNEFVQHSFLEGGWNMNRIVLNLTDTALPAAIRALAGESTNIGPTEGAPSTAAVMKRLRLCFLVSLRWLTLTSTMRKMRVNRSVHMSRPRLRQRLRQRLRPNPP